MDDEEKRKAWKRLDKALRNGDEIFDNTESPLECSRVFSPKHGVYVNLSLPSPTEPLNRDEYQDLTPYDPHEVLKERVQGVPPIPFVEHETTNPAEYAVQDLNFQYHSLEVLNETLKEKVREILSSPSEKYATLDPGQMLYELFICSNDRKKIFLVDNAGMGLIPFNNLTTNELALPENDRAYRKLEAKMSQTNPSFNQIRRLDYIRQKRAEKIRADGTLINPNSRSQRLSQKSPPSTSHHRPPGRSHPGVI